MNVATRGLGKRSGMVASFGLGRRVIGIVEVLTTVFTALSRPWATTAESRFWADAAANRIYDFGLDARSWAIYKGQRAWTFVTSARSWVRSVFR